MKRQKHLRSKYLAIALFAFIYLLYYPNLVAIDFETISFAETFPTKGSVCNVKILSKELRLKKFGSDIEINHSELPDSILKCVLFAKNIWESSITCPIPIIIDLEYKNIEHDIETDVIYFYTENEAIPNALYKSIMNESEGYSDGSIRINSNINWDCTVSHETISEYPNLTFALLRSFAKILGFGSAIRADDSEMLYWLVKRRYTIFDECIKTSDNKSVCDFSLNRGKPNQQLTDFLNSKDRLFYFAEKNQPYELEKSPSKDRSVLSYLKNSNSLMSFNPQKGAYYLRIDTLTRSVLKELGWNVSDKPSVEIVCDEVGDNGIMSAYSSHTFRIKSDAPTSVKAPKWQLSLPLADGNEEKMTLIDSGLSCTIPAIENESRYLVNVNGDICAYLDFSCQINGTEVHANQYRISFELKPTIEYINIVNIKQYPEQQTYDIHFEVKYYGSDHIDISVEEEYGSWLKNKTIYEPFWTKCLCEQIAAPFSAWVDFSISNNYGTDTFTIELGPYGDIIDSYKQYIISAADKNILHNSISHVDFIEIYNSQGTHLGKYNNTEDAMAKLAKGIYIIKEFHDNGTVKNIKQLIK